MEEYQEIRKEMYRVQLERWADLINFKSPYTLIKAIYYMETASFLLFTTQKIIKSPNFITFMYILTGLIGAFLLNASQEWLFYVGVFMFFTKGTFDWADGPLARRLNKTSFLGHALDCYGAYINDLAFRVAFVYYALVKNPDFTFLLPFCIFLLLIPDFRLFTDVQYLKRVTGVDSGDTKITRNSTFEKDLHNVDSINGGLKKWYFRYTSFLDGRARSIDFLLLTLIIDSVYNYGSMLLLILSVLIILRSIVLYLAGVYFSFNVYSEKL
jgi:hypothetical protein